MSLASFYGASWVRHVEKNPTDESLETGPLKNAGLEVGLTLLKHVCCFLMLNHVFLKTDPIQHLRVKMKVMKNGTKNRVKTPEFQKQINANVAAVKSS